MPTPKEQWFQAQADYWNGFINNLEFADSLTEIGYKVDIKDVEAWSAHEAEYEAKVRPLMHPSKNPNERVHLSHPKRFIYNASNLYRDADLHIKGMSPFVRRPFWTTGDGKKVPVQGCFIQPKGKRNIYHCQLWEESGLLDLGDIMVSRTLQRFGFLATDGKEIKASNPIVVLFPRIEEKNFLETVFSINTATMDGLKMVLDTKLAVPSDYFYERTGLTPEEMPFVLYVVGYPKRLQYSNVPSRDRANRKYVDKYIKA